MSDTTEGTTPAGWYPVAPGSSQLRWWDGTKWTEHVHDQAAAQSGGVPRAPEGTDPNTVWVWILALMPLLGIISFFFFNVNRYLHEILQAAPTATSDPTFVYRALLDSGYFAILGFGVLIYALGIVFAALDYRALKARGVIKPFHWAFSFIPSNYGYLVYMIGRFVIVKRRTGTGLAPLWVWIGAFVVTIIASLVWAISIFQNIATSIPTQ